MADFYTHIVQKCPSAVTDTFLRSLKETAKGKAATDSVQILEQTLTDSSFVWLPQKHLIPPCHIDRYLQESIRT